MDGKVGSGTRFTQNGFFRFAILCGIELAKLALSIQFRKKTNFSCQKKLYHISIPRTVFLKDIQIQIVQVDSQSLQHSH